MKKTLFWGLFVLSLFTFLLSACDSDSNDDNPAMPDIDNFSVAEWVINIVSVNDAKTDQLISIFWNGDPINLPFDTTVQLKIDGRVVNLESYEYVPGFYWGMADLTPGNIYNIEFWVNGVRKIQTDLRIVYQASGTFPNTFNPASSFSINWSLSSNNQYQMACLLAFKESDPEDQIDEYNKVLSPSARSYTFPANAVQSFGAGTWYEVEVNQANLKLVNKVAVISWHHLFSEYTKKSGGLDLDRVLLRSKELSNRLLNK